MQWTRNHLSFANVISVMALFVALGGSSYAAVQLSKNSVGAKQIKKNAVRAAEINRNAVGASEVRSNAIAGADVADGSIGSLDIGDDAIGSGELSDNGVGASELAPNSVGSADVVDGSLGANDLQAGLLNFPSVTLQRTDVNLPAGPGANQPGAETDGFTGCPAGQKIIGGSANTSSPAGATVLISRPSTDNIGSGGIPDDGEGFNFWKGTGRTETNASATMRVFAICVSGP